MRIILFTISTFLFLSVAPSTISANCKNPVEIKKGETKRGFTLTESGEILFEGTSVRTITEEYQNSIFVSFSQSENYAFILLVNQFYGGEDWLVFDTNSKTILMNKPASLEPGIIYQEEVIWADFKNYGREKYLIIPQGHESQTDYYIVNLNTKTAKTITLNFAGLSECQLQFLTNSHLWLKEDIVSVMILIAPNPWSELPTCKEDAIYNPWVATLHLKTNTYKLKK